MGAERALLKKLEAFAELEAKDLSRYEFALTTAIETTRDSISSSEEDLAERGKRAVVQSKQEKQDREALMSTAEKEEKAKGKGKKKVEGGDQIPGSCTVDQGSQMQSGTRTGMKRKAVLQELTEDMVTQGTQVIVIEDDQEVNTEELILNKSIIDVMENEGKDNGSCYKEVMEFLKKVCLIVCAILSLKNIFILHKLIIFIVSKNS